MAELQELDNQGSAEEVKDVDNFEVRGGNPVNVDEPHKEQDTTSQNGDISKDKSDDRNEEDEDDAVRLAKLTANVRDQDDLERDIGRQADQMLVDQADERDNKRLEKTLQEKEYGMILCLVQSSICAKLHIPQEISCLSPETRAAPSAARWFQHQEQIAR